MGYEDEEALLFQRVRVELICCQFDAARLERNKGLYEIGNSPKDIHSRREEKVGVALCGNRCFLCVDVEDVPSKTNMADGLK